MRLILAVSVVIAAPAFAGPFAFDSLTFDGLQNGEQVLSFYNGGVGGSGSGPGPLVGVSFTDGLAADATPIVFGPAARLTAPSVTMNLDDPWPGLVSFYFVGSGAVSFYSGLNATGNLVGSYVLSYPPFDPFGALPGSFRSAVFASSTGLQLDSITFGFQVVPEPASLLLLSLGIATLAGLKIDRCGLTVRKLICARCSRR
ncbi:MAG TPA: PEP-CTERM sorting domain-containing protein [Bryobacteraceae bacterium]|jgi:hypothetical protein